MVLQVSTDLVAINGLSASSITLCEITSLGPDDQHDPSMQYRKKKTHMKFLIIRWKLEPW
jgi:hypothetical protein